MNDKGNATSGEDGAADGTLTGIDELTAPITELAIAWGEGDRERGELLFRKVLRYLRPSARRLAWQLATHSTTDVLQAAFIEAKKVMPMKFISRRAFLKIYIQAMTYWMANEHRRRKAAKRSGQRTCPDVFDPAAPSEQREVQLLFDTQDVLMRQEENELITEQNRELFVQNLIIGVSQVDLADMYSLTRQTVAKHVRFVRALVARELAADYGRFGDADA